MEADLDTFLALAEALGIGFLIGIERERSELAAGVKPSAGIRTFALASLIGAVSVLTGGVPLLVTAIVIIGATRLVWITQQNDPSIGLTTSLALIVVVLLGALTTEKVLLAAGIGVVVASLLAARDSLHQFGREILTAAELRDGLILGVSALVVLPVLPDISFGPGGALNPRNFFVVVVLVMLIAALGHIATRIAGARLGLPVSGFLSGLVSSTATIAVLGSRAEENPSESKSASAGASASSLSSLLQIGVILLIVSPATLNATVMILGGACVVIGLYTAAIIYIGSKSDVESTMLELSSQVFSIKSAFGFAAIVATTTLISASLNDYFGNSAIIVVMAFAGLASTNSATFALASLVASGQISAADSALPLVAALSTNSVVRIWLAARCNNSYFKFSVAAGLMIQIAIFWTILGALSLLSG